MKEGFDQAYFDWFHDSLVSAQDTAYEPKTRALRAKLKAVIDRTDADAIVTHNVVGEYGHAHHRVLHAMVVDVLGDSYRERDHHDSTSSSSPPPAPLSPQSSSMRSSSTPELWVFDPRAKDEPPHPSADKNALYRRLYPSQRIYTEHNYTDRIRRVDAEEAAQDMVEGSMTGNAWKGYMCCFEGIAYQTLSSFVMAVCGVITPCTPPLMGSRAPLPPP